MSSVMVLVLLLLAHPNPKIGANWKINFSNYDFMARKGIAANIKEAVTFVSSKIGIEEFNRESVSQGVGTTYLYYWTSESNGALLHLLFNSAETGKHNRKWIMMQYCKLELALTKMRVTLPIPIFNKIRSSGEYSFSFVWHGLFAQSPAQGLAMHYLKSSRIPSKKALLELVSKEDQLLKKTLVAVSRNSCTAKQAKLTHSKFVNHSTAILKKIHSLLQNGP